MRHAIRSSLLGLFAAASFAVPASAETVDVTFLLVNDIYKMSGGSERGGFARLASVVRQERARGKPVVFVHAGDTISPSLMSGFDQGEHIITLLDMVPPDVFVPGNHEYDFGKDVFLKRKAESGFTWYAANLRNGDGSPVEGIAGTKMLEFGAAKIGIVGITADDSPVKSSPGDLKFLPSVATGVAEAKKMREAGADLVVAVAHTNRAQDRELFETRAFDLILSGDDHDLMLLFDGRTAMVESKEEGEFVTAIDLAIEVEEKDGRKSVSWYPNFRMMDTANVEPDPTVGAKVAELEKELSAELDVVLGKTTTALDSRKATVRGGEAAIGNLIADAMKEAVGADVAITNGGGIRGNKEYPAGSDVSRRAILEELPFGNKTVKLEVTGAVIRAALENGVSQVENAGGRFPQVSGMTVSFDPKAPAGSRVTDVQVAGAPLDDAKTYSLAVNDFMAGGGDGYAMLKDAKRILSETDAKLMANDVMAFVRAKGTIAPAIEGRVKPAGG